MEKPRQKIVNKHASYIEGQLPFLNYAKAANDNLDLGSGAVEATCKTLVTQRLKISGAKSRRPAASTTRLDSIMAETQACRVIST